MTPGRFGQQSGPVLNSEGNFEPFGTLPHWSTCSRPSPTLRKSWAGGPEWHCPGCGRTVPAGDDGVRAERHVTLRGVTLGGRDPPPGQLGGPAASADQNTNTPKARKKK